MDGTNPAAQALVEALKNPVLTDAERLALVAALQAVTRPAASVVPRASTPARRPKTARGAAGKTATRMPLTRAAIAALELPDSGERLVYDVQCPQLAVRLRPGGAAFVVIAWERERRRKTTRTLGKCSALTPEQARAAAQRIVAQIADGEDVRRARVSGATFAELVQAWHAEKSKTARTADELRDKVLHYAGKLAARSADEIAREDIGRIHHDIATKARKTIYKRIDGELRPVAIGEPGLPPTADKWRAAVAAVYAWAMHKGLAGANPAAGIRQAFDARGAARTRYLRGDELLRFWRALDADSDAHTRDAIKLLLFTGQRRGNVLGMRWGDVDLAAGVWALSAAQTKQRAAQAVPLVAQAREILQTRFAEAATDWVFPATRRGTDGAVGAMSEARLRDAWRRICTAAGIENLRPHDLRHTAGSWLAKLGTSEAIRQKALGHRTPAMAARYSHLELDPVADALQRTANAIVAAATKPAAKVRKFKGGAA